MGPVFDVVSCLARPLRSRAVVRLRGRGISLAMNPEDVRVGLGHDTHRLVPNRKFILGGVTIRFDRGLEGHSDADVLLHAVTDALLGAAGAGDIGEWFPNDETEWKQADSALFVRRAVAVLHKQNWQIANLDCTVFAERPKLSEYKLEIRERLAELLDIPPNSVNVKAKSGERVGPIGREEAVSADAIVLLVRATKDAGNDQMQ